MTYEPGTLEVALTVVAGRLMGGTVYKQYVERLGLKGSERVLDFGCGSGNPALYLAPILQRGGGHLTCVDVSRRWIEVARRRLGKYPHVDFRLGDIGSLGLPDASYDAVFVHFVLHEIPTADRPRVVQHLARALAAGGKLFIREPLRFLDPEEIRRRMQRSGLQEVDSQVLDMPTQGRAYEGTYCKLSDA